jgi:cobalamin biosynthesis Mg chelatase CobN
MSFRALSLGLLVLLLVLWGGGPALGLVDECLLPGICVGEEPADDDGDDDGSTTTTTEPTTTTTEPATTTTTEPATTTTTKPTTTTTAPSTTTTTAPTTTTTSPTTTSSTAAPPTTTSTSSATTSTAPATPSSPTTTPPPNTSSTAADDEDGVVAALPGAGGSDGTGTRSPFDPYAILFGELPTQEAASDDSGAPPPADEPQTGTGAAALDIPRWESVDAPTADLSWLVDPSHPLGYWVLWSGVLMAAVVLVALLWRALRDRPDLH